MSRNAGLKAYNKKIKKKVELLQSQLVKSNLLDTLPECHCCRGRGYVQTSIPSGGLFVELCSNCVGTGRIFFDKNMDLHELKNDGCGTGTKATALGN